MTVHELQQEIIRLKKEQGVCILAHAYQRHDIWEIADFVGDSFGLSEKAAGADCETLIMCGVRFMAQTAKIMSPKKRVILPVSDAGCPMADQIEPETLEYLKAQHPGAVVVSYVNTTAEVKAHSDVCVTSSSAVKIIGRIESRDILFVPDCNLGAWIAERLPEKNIILMRGGCPTHLRIGMAEVKAARLLHPEALLLAHPECRPEVSAAADFTGSTTEIMDYAENSGKKEFIIGTENSIAEHLQYLCPEKMFYPLSKDCVCHNMQLTTLMSVYNCLLGRGGEEIELAPAVSAAARRSIDEMLRLGK